MKYCYSCHSLKYSRWGRVANDLQIPEDIFFEYLVPDQDAGPYDLMVAPIHELEIDNAPPDLTLVARKRTSSWVYTYLRAFYDDSSTTYGSNNLVYPGVNMPNILAPIQGNQKLRGNWFRGRFPVEAPRPPQKGEKQIPGPKNHAKKHLFRQKLS